MPSQILPASAVKLTSQTTLRRYYASPGIARGFCGTCGGLVFWQREGGDTINVTLGSLDKAHLIEHGERLTSGTTHYWCDAMIPGATDNLRGEKWKGYSFGEGAELVP